MIKKHRFFKLILLTIISIWIIISTFFYFQHRVQVDRYEINKYIEFDDFGILIKNIERYNYEKNTDTHNFQPKRRISREIIYKLNLPGTVIIKLLNIDYFYSQPYRTTGESYEYLLNAEVIFNPNEITYETIIENFSSNIDIYLYKNDNNSQKHFSATGTRSSSSQNIIHFSSSDNWIKSDTHSLSIKNKDGNEKLLVLIDKPYTTTTYGYFNRRVYDYDRMSSDVTRHFLSNYYSDNKKDSVSNIQGDSIASFNWDVLDKYESFIIDNYKLSYLGRFKEQENVFIMSVSDDTQMNTLDFYLIYKDLSWYIIDVE